MDANSIAAECHKFGMHAFKYPVQESKISGALNGTSSNRSFQVNDFWENKIERRVFVVAIQKLSDKVSHKYNI